MSNFLEKRLWLSVLLLAALVYVLVATLLHLGSEMPSLAPLRERPHPARWSLAGDQAAQWFSVPALAAVTTGTNIVNPFYTLHFQPPPPPPTKRIELVYQGCVEASSGLKLGYVQVEGGLLILTNGAKVVADHLVKDIQRRRLTLTNAAGQTNVLEFNVKKGLDVPAS
jgi:hypothetical protein